MQQTLIIFESKYGTTKEIVEIMTKVLGPAKSVTPNEFSEKDRKADLVIIASPIYYEELIPDIAQFISSNQEWLQEKLVALLGVAMVESVGNEALKPFQEMLGDCVIWLGTTKGRILIHQLTEEDRSEIERFSKITGTPFRDQNLMSYEDVIEKSLMLKELRDARIKSPTREELKKAVEDFLNSHNTCALATGFKNRIRSTPLEYFYNDGIIYFISEGGEKFANILLNNKVSISIFDPYTGMQSLGGLQIEGTASILEVGSEEYLSVLESRGISYEKIKNLPFNMNIIKIALEKAEFLSSEFQSNGYNPRQIYFFKRNED